MATAESAAHVQDFQVSDLVESTHGWPAIHKNGDVAVIYSTGPSPQTIRVNIFKRIENDAAGNPQWAKKQALVLGKPQAALTPTGGALPSCSHPTICAIDDGFAYFYERRDTTIPATTMTAGGLQIEMGKLVLPAYGEDQYTVRKSAIEGKGYVLDNTVIAGHAGGVPRCVRYRKNLVAVVYGHQLSYSLAAADDQQRQYDVRAAYLDFSPDGKPVFISGGNRTGGSATGEATDGGYAAGPTQTWLVNAINLDDDPNLVNFNSGGGLPSCCISHLGDLVVAYEVRQNRNGTGGIVVKIFKGPYRASGLDTAAIYTNTASFGATAAMLARRPMLAFRNVFDEGVPLTGTNNPPILLVYGDLDTNSAVAQTAKAFTLTFPLNNQASPTIAQVAIAPNQNYDATADDQALPFAVEASFISAFVIQEALVNTSGGDGYKLKLVHTNGSVEIMLSTQVARPQRPNFQARAIADGSRIAAFVHEGQEEAGTGAEHVYLELFAF